MFPTLLAIDLDGTLLNASGSLDPETKPLLDRIRTRGCEVVVSTGRTHSESVRFLEALELEGVMIGSAGAVISEVATGRTVERNVIPAPTLRGMLEGLLAHGHLIQLLQDVSSASGLCGVYTHENLYMLVVTTVKCRSPAAPTTRAPRAHTHVPLLT